MFVNLRNETENSEGEKDNEQKLRMNRSENDRAWKPEGSLVDVVV